MGVSLLKIIVIARSLGSLERKLLIKNCARARRIFGEIAVAYVLGERDAYDAAPIIDPSVTFYLILNRRIERNAALSRSVGYDALKVTKNDLVLFLDGDMLVTEKYLQYLHNLSSDHDKYLALCARTDIRGDAKCFHRRRLYFGINKNGRINKLYGSMALRGIPFEKYNVMTHDMEEQWFLCALKSSTAPHLVYEKIGILHFDRFVGVNRKIRLLITSRGVGFWQGLFRDASLRRIASDAVFILQQKKSVTEILKLLVVSVISFPKLFLFRMPQRINYVEINNDST